MNYQIEDEDVRLMASIAGTLVRLRGLPHQDGGAEGIDTVWLSVRPDSIQPWLAPRGGRLRKAFELIKRW